VVVGFGVGRRTQNLHARELWLAPDLPAHVQGVAIGQRIADHKQVGAEFVDHQPGIEAVANNVQFQPLVASGAMGQRIHQRRIVIDDKQLAAAAVNVISWNVVFTHEAEQFLAWNAAKAAAGDVKTFKLTGVEATDDRL